MWGIRKTEMLLLGEASLCYGRQPVWQTSAGGRSLVNRDELRQRFQEAAYTLRRLPMPRHGLPAGFRVTWPDIAFEWLSYSSPSRAPRIPPTPHEITRLDEVLGWISAWLTREQRQIIWARGRGWTWRQIEALDEMERDGRGRQGPRLRCILGDAEARILAELNGTPHRMRIDAKGHRRLAGERKGLGASDPQPEPVRLSGGL
jgi:hypothetical protein